MTIFGRKGKNYEENGWPNIKMNIKITTKIFYQKKKDWNKKEVKKKCVKKGLCSGKT